MVESHSFLLPVTGVKDIPDKNSVFLPFSPKKDPHKIEFCAEAENSQI